MRNFITENFEIVVTLIIAVLGVTLFKISKSKKITQKKIKTKSGDVVAGNKTVNGNDKKD